MKFNGRVNNGGIHIAQGTAQQRAVATRWCQVFIDRGLLRRYRRNGRASTVPVEL
jgi:hypothetical protein